MSKVILITGDLASGKSTLAESLSSLLNYVCLTKDKVKEIICDSIGFTTREENRKISISSVKTMVHFLEKTLKVNQNVILEANFRFNEIKEIEEIARTYNSKLSIIYLTGDYEVIYKRFLDRVPYRHKAHLSMGLDKDFNKFKDYVNSLREEINMIDCKKIDISKLNKQEVLNIAIEYLK